jgi:hypothetical protein
MPLNYCLNSMAYVLSTGVVLRISYFDNQKECRAITVLWRQQQLVWS